VEYWLNAIIRAGGERETRKGGKGCATITFPDQQVGSPDLTKDKENRLEGAKLSCPGILQRSRKIKRIQQLNAPTAEGQGLERRKKRSGVNSPESLTLPKSSDLSREEAGKGIAAPW